MDSDLIRPADILGPDGRIAARLNHYEHRQQQLDMADAVSQALQNRRIRSVRHGAIEPSYAVEQDFQDTRHCQQSCDIPVADRLQNFTAVQRTVDVGRRRSRPQRQQ